MSADSPKTAERARQPEALASLKAAAKNHGMKPAGQGLDARPDTAPKRADPEQKNKKAESILHASAEADTHRRA